MIFKPLEYILLFYYIQMDRYKPHLSTLLSSHQHIVELMASFKD